jgi:hypothetical protein
MIAKPYKVNYKCWVVFKKFGIDGQIITLTFDIFSK